MQLDTAGASLRLIVGILAVWRITHFLAREDGPGDVVVRLRASVGNGFFGRLMDCFNCLSVWVSAPIALAIVSWRTIDVGLVWLALSAGACLLERIGQPPVLIEKMSDTDLDRPIVEHDR